MGKNDLKLFPNNKNFILAKAYVPSWRLEEAASLQIENPSDFSVYWEAQGAFQSAAINPINKKLVGKSNDCTIYWVRKGFTMDIPFGYTDDGGTYGVLKCKFRIATEGGNRQIEALKNKAVAFPNAWKDETIDNVTYYYLMDYFVDEKSNGGKQKGLSVELRNSWLGEIKALIRALGDDISVENANRNENLKNKINELASEWGLTFEGFTKLGKRINAQEG